MDVVKTFGSTMKKVSKKEVEARIFYYLKIENGNTAVPYHRQVWSVLHVIVWERNR
jgi:hypothetical protein